MKVTTNERIMSLCAELGISRELIAGRGLSECEEASVLDVAEVGTDGRSYLLVPAAARAWQDLGTSALGDGISLFIVSAFRSVDRQVEIVRRKIDSGIAIEDILLVCAPPGFSEHHTGRAVDVSTPGSPALEVDFERTAAFAWLTTHAHEFGFRLSYPRNNQCGYQYEPWHWCFENALLANNHPFPLNRR